MAKYDWNNLEKEYITGKYKTVKSFLKDKGIPYNGNTNKATKGWKEKKVTAEKKKSAKTIEKIIEKQAEKDANEIVTISSVADLLLKKVYDAVKELNIHADMFGNQNESIIDRGDLKKLTSALKDIDDILKDKKNTDEIEDLTVLADLFGFGDKK